MKDVVEILGVPFSKWNMEQTVRKITDIIDSKHEDKPFHIITANPEIVMIAQEDQVIRDVTEKADLITPDGIGIVMASRWKGEPVQERVAGYDLLLKLLEEGNLFGWSFYFLGSSEEVNKAATDIISKRYPNVVLAGRHNGFFKDKEDEVIRSIQNSKADILVVALGAPRQELWIYNNKNRLNTKVAIGVGGSLDVIAGKVKRAPELWQKLNLEWLYRLLSQPTRWKRQLVLPKFAIKAYMEASRSKK
ncbi:MAG TPA: WecB/TagA/CpsF family glycosyltransferase [Bacillota bacterium]|nr:WecB/TagA/CpsF family glycosyltransferase [Bacillota bacterium]